VRRERSGVGCIQNSFFRLSTFYFDRIWVKAYPFFFSNLKIKEYRDIYREYRESGVFESMTKHFFDFYRTIRCLQIALRKNIEIKHVSECLEIMRYGEREFLVFTRFHDFFTVGGLQLTKDQILNARLLTYTVVIGDKLHYEKVFYLPLNSWFRVMVKPYLERFTPPMVRVFLNAIEYAKSKVGFDYSDYEYSNSNFVDPYAEGFDFKSFLEVNRSIVDYIKTKLPSEVSRLWKVFFGREEKLTVKVTQVEISHDCYVDKIRLLNAVRVLAGRTKTLKYDIPLKDGYTWSNDIGVKYYVTVKRGLQTKVYSKAVNKRLNRVLNRLELTMRVNMKVNEFNLSSVFSRDVLDLISDINMGLGDKSVLEEVRKTISVYIPGGVENRELHEIFLLDLFIHGQVKGSSVYRGVAIVYKRRGLIEVKARGRYSVYRLKPEYLFVHEKIRELLTGLPLDLLNLPQPTGAKEKQ
jgi:hypothetical protein